MADQRVILSWMVLCLSISVCCGKRCGYRVYQTRDEELRDDMEKHKLPTHVIDQDGSVPVAFGIKECPWDCCWEHASQRDVCCSFPMDVVIAGAVGVLAFLIVVATIVLLGCFYLSKNLEQNSTEI